MPCSNCIYWTFKTNKVGYVSEGVHVESRLGKCSNEQVKNMVYFVPDVTFSTLTHNLLFDESFHCSEQKSDNS